MVGSLFANIDFPAPGGPIKITLCPPAAAISNDLFIFCCPLTSLKSMDDSVNFFENSTQEFETKRNTKEFKQIQAVYESYKTYINFLNN